LATYCAVRVSRFLTFVRNAATNNPFYLDSLYGLGLAGMLIVVMFYVKDTNYFTEETVIVPHLIEEQAKIEGLVNEEQINLEFLKEQRAAAMVLEKSGQKTEITAA